MSSKGIKTQGKSEATEIGSNLRWIRLWHGYSQQDLADFLCITPQQIQKYETGENRLPIEKLFRLKTFFQISFEAFFCGLSLEKENHADIHMRYPSVSMYKKLSKVKDPAMQKKIEKIIDVLSA